MGSRLGSGGSRTYNGEASLSIALDADRESHVVPTLDVLEQKVRLLRKHRLARGGIDDGERELKRGRFAQNHRRG
jgi:hypothetical protein